MSRRTVIIDLEGFELTQEEIVACDQLIKKIKKEIQNDDNKCSI